MKKFTILALVFLLSAGMLTGCGCTSSDMNTTTNTTNTRPLPNTTPATTRPSTAPSTNMTMPSMDDVIPGPEDTIDSTNGANKNTDETLTKSKSGGGF